MRLKGSNGNEYKGEVKGGVFAIYNEKGENVGNFSNADEAVKMGGYTVIGDEAGDASPEQTADPKTDPKTDTPPSSSETEKTPA